MPRLPCGRAVFYEARRGELIAFAERSLELSSIEDGGASYRETLEGLLERAERRGDASRIAELEAMLACPPLPPARAYLWDTYWRLRRRKGGTGFGASPIEWPDLHAFTLQSRFHLAPWEVELIEAIDDCYLAEQARASRRSETPPGKKGQ